MEIAATSCGDASTDGVVVTSSGSLVGTGIGDAVSCVFGSKTTCSGEPGDSFIGLEGFGIFTAADVAAASPSIVVEGGANTLAKRRRLVRIHIMTLQKKKKGVNVKIPAQHPEKAFWSSTFVEGPPLPDLRDIRHPPSKRQLGEGLV